MDRDAARPLVRSSALTSTRFGFLALLTVLSWAGLLASPAHATAQYFGRNKVQYDDFDFRTLETEHFRIYFYRSESDRGVRDAGRMAERWYGRLSRTLQHAFREGVRKPILLYANQPDFQQTNAIPGFISQATGGVTESIRNRVVMPFAESYGETDHVLGHELVHAFQYDIARAGRGGGSTSFRQLPTWAVEGLAEYLSVGRRSPHTAMWMRDAVLRDDLPTIRDLSEGREYFPYRFGHALWAYIGGRFGDDAVVRFYRAAAEKGTAGASRTVLGLPLDTLSRDWQRATTRQFTPAMVDRSDPVDVGTRVVPREEEGTGLIISPAVSPDGSRLAYLGRSDDPFTIDVTLADARTGEVLGQLASASSDPHLDALAYMNTSGAWSPDGTRFAFATVAQGDNQVAVADVADRSIVRRYRLPGVGAVYSMDWSPDGSRLVFSGSASGITDLYLLDLDDGTVKELTHDRWAQLQPAFSPDGSSIAYSTDRGDEESLERLDFPRTALGFLDLRSGETRLRRPFPGAKHIDPRWSPDGSSLYFVSDRDGFSDVYRLSVDDGSLWRVTRIATGVSGITELSPALAVARESGDVLFTVFRDGEYMVRRLPGEQARGEPVERAGRMTADAGALPPRRPTRPVRVGAYLADPSGLGDPATFRRSDYDPSLGLDYVSQPTAGIAVDRFGTSLGGSVAAFFSDMLGNRQLGVALQANGGVKDIGAQVAYTGLGDRTNWTLQGGRIPYRTTFFRRGTGMVDGEEVPTADLIIDRTALNRVSGGIQYPFSRTRRLEVNAGATLLTFDREAIRTYLQEGVPVARERVDLDAPGNLTLYNASAALVEDHSFFGLTSPVKGDRGRLEVEGNFGDLSFANVLADYRRYLFSNPLTLALRGYHLGRYGPDAESPRLSPLFLGFERFVRGYEVDSFDGSAECTEVPGEPRACPELDRLVGSRMAVANVELRAPLNGVEDFGILEWGGIPTELSLFLDAGVAWTSGDSPTLTLAERSTERIPVFSSGVSARFNILGRFVLEAYWAYPFQRPEHGGVWGFQLAPGW